MPTFHSNTNNKPNNLGKPNPPITLRRDAGRTPGHRDRRNPPRNPLRRAVRNPLRRGWRRATRAPRRDAGHTTRHHPHPAPTSTNTPHHSTPTTHATKSAREWAGGEGRAPERDGIGATGTLPVAPLLPLQPQKPEHGSQQIQHLIGIGHRPKNHQPKSFE